MPVADNWIDEDVEQDAILFDQTSHWPKRTEKRHIRCKFYGGRIIYTF